MHLIAYTTKSPSILGALPVASNDHTLRELINRRKREHHSAERGAVNESVPTPSSPADSSSSRPGTATRSSHLSPSPPLAHTLHRATSSSSLRDASTSKYRPVTASALEGPIRSRPTSAHESHFQPYDLARPRSDYSTDPTRSTDTTTLSSSSKQAPPPPLPPLQTSRIAMSAPPHSYPRQFGYSPPASTASTRPSTSSSFGLEQTGMISSTLSSPVVQHSPVYPYASSSDNAAGRQLPPVHVLASGLTAASADSPPLDTGVPRAAFPSTTRHHPLYPPTLGYRGLPQAIMQDPPSPPPTAQTTDRWRMSEDERQLSLLGRKL
ncbi:hypothetical protein OIO90_003753 [Microbotryomycetes sp. JL221]|nr:hypothetical protein OIO90_003753 [Microbotryomycetes sp. JL221]